MAGYALYRVARIFSQAVQAAPHGMQVVIVPMPITKARRRERGFNQCELILDEIQKLDTEKRLVYARNLITRVRHTSRQTMKDRAGRLESVKDLFALNETAASRIRLHASNLFIVIIDDVITTGSTMKDAIMTLRHAGFEHTYGLAVAH